MAAPNGAFGFVNAPARYRTPRIAPERWERHRSHITELYLESGKTLAEVVTLMGVNHGFYANERQYIYHLHTWGVRRQARGGTAIAIPAPRGESDNASGVDRRGRLKKHARPSASIHSSSSVDSAFSRPPRKKVEYDTVVSSKPPSSDVSSGDLEQVELSLAAMDATAFPLHYLTLQENGFYGQWSSPPISSSREGGPVDPTHREAPVAELPSLPHAASPPPARTLRTIDRNRPIETFSAQDIADIKHAAECLSMLCFDQEAFALYATILTRQLLDPACCKKTSWYLVIRCAYTASIPEHVEVVQKILQAELAWLQQPQFTGQSAAIALLLHMLLALTSSANGNPEDAAASTNRARSYLDPTEQCLEAIFQHLPPDDRSLDLAVFQNISWLLENDIGYCDLTSPLSLLHGDRVPLEDWILRRVPGPFELQNNGRMANPCIRSCVLWCKGSLNLLRSSPRVPEVSNIVADDVSFAGAVSNGLFIILWEHWTTGAFPAESAWMNETQDRMGISATELLLLICRIICTSNQGWNTPQMSNDDRILRLCANADGLIQKPDFILARRFLRHYLWRNTMAKRFPRRSAVRKLDKAHVIHSFEKAMRVQFPDLDVIRDPANPVSVFAGGENLPVVDKPQQRSPTLASSLESDDLSNFRKISAHAMLQLNKLARGSWSTLFLSRSESRTKLSTAGISDITASFRSMSIRSESASRERASSRQVASTILTGGNRRLEQQGAERERELEPDRGSVST
ncbi:hypothetical protein OQA88_2685 [Cercophora sp. LCS_1]